ncbi:SRPBCC family protein [Streptomyces sp. NPDC026665]|uniref:SRPBCC family protein n=1 Tax=Streptomyces sp. NPDC026665 TaxID=3154798 RepID=UPI0033CFA3F8
MVEFERTLTLHHPLPDVVAYLADFSHAEEWDPGIVSCRPTMADVPVSEGVEWVSVSTFCGVRTGLRCRLARLEDQRLTFVGRNRTATSTDDLIFRRENGATLLTYRARIEFHGLARLASPFLREEVEHLGDEVADRMAQAVDSHFGVGGDSTG